MALQSTLFSPHDVRKSTFSPTSYWCPPPFETLSPPRANDCPPDLDGSGVTASLFQFSACACVSGQLAVGQI